MILEILVTILGTLHCGVEGAKYINISSTECGGAYDVETWGDVIIRFDGSAQIEKCLYKIDVNKYGKVICLSPISFEITNRVAGISVNLYDGAYSLTLNPEIFNAANRPPETPTCAKSRGITLAFLSTSGQPGDANIVVRVFTETQDSAYFTADAKRTVMWVVVGVVISLGVISAALLVMFVFCCCRKRPLKHVGQLHRDPFPIDAEHPMTDINAEEVFAEQIESRSQPEELPRDTTYEITNTEEELGAIGGKSFEFETLSVNASQIVHTLDYENAGFAIESET